MSGSRYRHDPEGERLPIKLEPTSNGEFVPEPLTAQEEATVAQAQQTASDNARRRGQSRRDYMVSPSAAAATLVALNEAAAAQGRTGGSYVLPPDAGLDDEAAASVVCGDEFIFDVQNHAVNADGPWRQSTGAEKMLRHLKMAWARVRPNEEAASEYGYLNFMDGDHYVKDMFLDSDTHTACMSVTAVNHEEEELTPKEADLIRALVDRLGLGCRLLLHGKALPNFPGELDRLTELRERWGVAAWKLYTQMGPAPEHAGYWLDDPDVMDPFVAHSRKLGVDIICAHKGLPFVDTAYAHSTSRDVGGAAKRYPDMKFLIYHAGYQSGRPEGAYDPDKANAGIDSLVKSLIDNEVAPNTNVYAELGAVWRSNMANPEMAAHMWGKLLKYVGEDNVMWGTDCTWAGSPQDQIQAFRAFQISEEFQERYGYPKLTPELKAKIFGFNAARVYGVTIPDLKQRASADEVAKARENYLNARDPSFLSHGPKNAAELAALRGQ